MVVAGAIVVAGVAAWLIFGSLSTAHPKTPGANVVRLSLDDRALSDPVQISTVTTGTASLASCADSAHGTGPVKGLLEIPKLGVTAPVEQGNAGAQLGVSVGHDPYSVWPGTTGNSLLAAHDAGYFMRLPQLSAGDTILYVGPCTTYAFSVSGHRIASPGVAIDNTRAPALTLVTGWPLDALGSTSERYLVTADEVSQSFTAGASPQYLTTSPPPSAPVPPALAAQGLTLTTYALPMGTLSLIGSPDETWAQTTNPASAEKPAVEDYIAGVRSLTQDRLAWWGDVAPGVAPPTALIGARNPAYASGLDIFEFATGTRVDSLTLNNHVTVTGGRAPGRYSVTVSETVEGGKLFITQWTMQRL